MKKIICTLLTASLCTASLAGAGCMTVFAQENEGEKTVVTFQTWNPADSGEGSPIYQIIDAFEEENPDIEINYVYVGSGSHLDQLRVGLMGGEGPDVYGMSAGSAYSEFRDFEEDLTSYCQESWGENWEDKFLDFCMDIVKDEDGAVYGVPLGLTYAGYAWADTNMLADYGLSVPTSYAELKEAAKTLREQNQFPMAIGAKDTWLNLDCWMSMAADIDAEALYAAINGEKSFTDPALLESFTLWQELFSNGVFQDGAVGMTLYNDVNDMFQREGSIPMFMNGSWAMNMYTLSDEETRSNFNGENSDHDIFLIDWNDDGSVCPVTASVDVILCMNPESEVKEAAFKWIDYLVNEGQDLLVNGYLEYMPSRADMELNVSGLSEDGQKNLEYIIQNGTNNVAGVRGIENAELSTVICDMLTALAINEVTPEDAAAQIQAVSESIR